MQTNVKGNTGMGESHISARGPRRALHMEVPAERVGGEYERYRAVHRRVLFGVEQ